MLTVMFTYSLSMHWYSANLYTRVSTILVLKACYPSVPNMTFFSVCLVSPWLLLSLSAIYVCAFLYLCVLVLTVTCTRSREQSVVAPEAADFSLPQVSCCVA